MSAVLERLKAAVAPRYDIDRELGGGAIATTYVAHDRIHDREVVFNVLRPDVSASLDPDRFIAGITSAAALTHQHLVGLLDAGTADSFLYYVTMQVEGVTVRDKLDMHGPAPLSQVSHILCDVVEALVHAHQSGVLHLNVSPDHILLSGREALLTNVGVAQAIRDAMTGTSAASPELGPPEYAAPECASGSSPGDQQTDIYQVGVLGYELLTGQPPFVAGSARRVLAAIQKGTPQPVSDRRADTPPSLAQLVTKCLARAPADRWQSMTELRSQLVRQAAESDIAGAVPEAIDDIGPYRIRRVLGKGGMGVVYLAEQTHPVKRQVALKVIKLGMDTKQILARFHAERQVLALLDHPHIAKVFEAGATNTGRPYFAMELVEGDPITSYCDRQQLSIVTRLELFVRLCHATQHAHQKGIIHRDLKPSNVLVRANGEIVPKIIDFGLAKSMGPALTDRTLETAADQVIGTPAYMSPEQVTRSDVDTRTDIYSLGVMLYELLVGTLPFDPDVLASDPLVLREAIQRTDPPSPSARFESLGTSQGGIAAARHTEPGGLRRELRGDLDWIVGKALEKDPGRRYATASGLARDLERHLAHEPVEARPPSAGYRMGKFVQRHKAGVVAGGLVAASVVAGLIGTTTLWLRATRAEQEAATEAVTAQQVSDFLVGLFEVSDPSEALGDTITAREILDKGAKEITEGLKDQPLVQARLMTTMGTVYTKLGLYEQARVMLEEAGTLRRNFLGSDHPDVAESLSQLGSLYQTLGRYAKAESLLQRAVAIQEQRTGLDDATLSTVLHNLAGLFLFQGRDDEAAPLLERALAIDQKELGADHPDLEKTRSGLGVLYVRQGKYAEAARVFQRSLAIREKALGPEHPDLAPALSNLGAIYMRLGRYAEGESVLERGLAIRKKVLGPDHPNVGWDLTNLASIYKEQGRYAEAEGLMERALVIAEKAVGPEHADVAWTLQGLGYIYIAQGKHAEADAVLRRALAIGEKALGPDHREVAYSLDNLATLYTSRGRYTEAVPLYERALVIKEKAFGSDHPELANGLSIFASHYAGRGWYAEAEPLYRRALAIQENALEPEHPDLLETLHGLAALLRSTGRRAEADSLEAGVDSVPTKRSDDGSRS